MPGLLAGENSSSERAPAADLCNGSCRMISMNLAERQLRYNFARSFRYVAVNASGITLVSDNTGMKLVSPPHLGTT